ncbi:unnamed protein product [Mytilus edulis]|uniref:Ankyrin repeat protein n=1 Tax=Mytilus edulis TaxID=6550 RepID=A0A8S3UL96_MYTED|nr:unnamed protein product [Mytilus edulis]
MRLSLKERWDICHSYLNEVDMKALEDETIVMYSFFPKLCSSYSSFENIAVESFFKAPYEIIEDEIHNFKIKSQISFMALAVLAIKQTISNISFSIDSREYDKLYQDVFHESAVLQYPSKNLLKSSLVAFIGSYVKKDKDDFMFSNETLQNMVLRCIANTLIESVIQHCKTDKILIDIANNEGCKPFVYACENYCTPVAKYLLHHCAKWIHVDEKYPIRNNGSVLHIVSARGYVNLVILLLKHKADVNLQDEHMCTPLHLAKNSAVVEALLHYNANINAVNKLGRSPNKRWFNTLHEACRNERLSAVQILLDNQANVNEANKHGWTALFSCARGCRAIVDVLLQHDANVNICDEDKVSPLVLACKEENTNVVGELLRSKANVNYCDKDKCSSLLVACKTGNVELASLLLRYSADINLADTDMITPLHAACMNNNNTKLVLTLIESNANVNAADKTGQTPLFKSIFNEYTAIVDILLRYGAFIDIYDKSGLSPVAVANRKGNKTVIRALKQHRPINKIV